MQTILLAGEKQSGKSSAAEYIHNLFCKEKIKDGHINIEKYVPDGLSLSVKNFDIPYYSRKPLDLLAMTPAHAKCKIYNFADPLKYIIHDLFGVPLYRLYGTDVDKSQLTDIKWGKLSNCINDVNLRSRIKNEKLTDKYMTVRELLQWYATICKQLDPECFVKATLRKIEEDKSKLSIIADCRYPEEFRLTQKTNPIKIRCILPNEDTHDSEKAINSIPLEDYDLVLEKNKISIEQKNKLIYDLLESRGLCT